MRIVGGRWRGKPLSAPEGRGTRPTTDRTRESMASMVLSAFDLDLSDVAVLDAFAGSGALGLEMLSRGARSCTFVERDRRAAEVVRRNVRSVGAGPAEARLKVGDAFRLAESGGLPGGPFDLVLLDPPYATEAALVAKLVDDLARTGHLTHDALVLYERAADAPGLELAHSEQLRSKKHGATATDLLRLSPITDETVPDEEVSR